VRENVTEGLNLSPGPHGHYQFLEMRKVSSN
jgi:hypothetical protein